jgi:hypothetical protein
MTAFNIDGFRKWLFAQIRIQNRLAKHETENAVLALIRDTRALTLRRVENELDRFVGSGDTNTDQRLALEVSYAFIRAVVAFFESHAVIVRDEQVAELINFGVFCISQLVQEFPSVAAFEQCRDVQRRQP